MNPILRLTRGIQKHAQTGESLDVVIETQDELLELKMAVQDLVAMKHKEEVR